MGTVHSHPTVTYVGKTRQSFLLGVLELLITPSRLRSQSVEVSILFPRVIKNGKHGRAEARAETGLEVQSVRSYLLSVFCARP